MQCPFTAALTGTTSAVMVVHAAGLEAVAYADAPSAVQDTEAMVQSYVEGVSQVAGLPPTRRGCAAALGTLPTQLLLPRGQRVLQALAQGMQVCLAHATGLGRCQAPAIPSLVSMEQLSFWPRRADTQDAQCGQLRFHC